MSEQAECERECEHGGRNQSRPRAETQTGQATRTEKSQHGGMVF
jgi:hypothetical protein